MDDRQLWEAIRRKDANAFDTLYRSYGTGLQRFLKQFLGNRQAAEDVTQETFTNIWQHPNGFDPQRGTLRSYVFGVGRKRAVDWWRKQKPQSHSATEPVEGCKAETQSLIGNAFDKLPAAQRTILWLREVEGESYAELAQILGIPEGTVRSRLFAARKAWRQLRQFREGSFGSLVMDQAIRKTTGSWQSLITTRKFCRRRENHSKTMTLDPLGWKGS